MSVSLCEKEKDCLSPGSPLAGFGPPVSCGGCCSLSVGCAWRGAAGCSCLRCLGSAVSVRLVSRSVARSEFAARRAALRASLVSRFGSSARIEHTALESRVYLNGDVLVYVYYRHDLDSSVRIVD